VGALCGSRKISVSQFIVRRALLAVPTFFGITILSFLLLSLAPGDAVSLLMADAANLNSADVVTIRSAYGLDQPIPLQYLRWLAHLLTGDFGHSILSGRPVLGKARLPDCWHGFMTYNKGRY